MSGSLSADSPFTDPAEAWLADLRLDTDRSEGTKEVYERELRSLVLPTFQHYTVREVTVGRVERFLKEQRTRSFARAKHSRTILSMVMGFAVRRELVPRNPVKETSRMKTPKRTPKALTRAQIQAIRTAVRDWRMEKGSLGPHPDGQVRDLIEVMLGTAMRIGEALALRKCDADMAANPPTVTVSGTVVVRQGIGVLRQPTPKTDESNRVVAVPPFAAAIIRRRLALLGTETEEHLLFFTRNGTPLAPHNVRRTFRQILQLAGLEGADITPHAFRRTGATLLANEVNIETAAAVLGHTSVATTREHYAEPDRTVDPVPAQILQRLAPEP
ncbi:tyrosine-type recombinase/integrase [Micromonospora sp. DT81.3]|uniref:tyrosine-type recombinase/integrase n=1 Tax=Micromonospora sp. DT81.3 TaxID=3416523 RepID=UPI003CE9B6ED